MMRKKFEAGFKAKVALEAVKGEKTPGFFTIKPGLGASREPAGSPFSG